MHVWAVNISKLVTDATNITFAIIYKFDYVLSISIFKFDLDLF